VRNLEIIDETAERLPGFLLAAAPKFQLLQNLSLLLVSADFASLGRVSVNHTQLTNIEQLETDIWSAANNLRANSKLTTGESVARQVYQHVWQQNVNGLFQAAV
jgi:hypothetical protein